MAFLNKGPLFEGYLFPIQIGAYYLVTATTTYYLHLVTTYTYYYLLLGRLATVLVERKTMKNR
jgi:hypothetical protein